MPTAFEVRAARLEDAPALARLLGELGFPAAVDVVAQRLGTLTRAGETALVGVQGREVLGLVTVHVTPVLHRPTPVGRLTALVVASRARGRGLGRAGLAAAAAFVLSVALAAGALGAQVSGAQAPAAIQHAVLGEPNQRTPEVSTEELRRILAERSATVFDARPFHEYAMSHIPGARNVAAKPGVPVSMYVSDVAEIGRTLGGDKAAPIVLYCNGPYCGKSKRLADELLAAGYANVRRYQLGIPVWRALGGICEIEAEGLRHVLGQDRTAVLIDAREAHEFRTGSLPQARSIPRSLVLEGKDVGEVKRAKDDGRLPMEDHNTRIVVVGRDAAAARYVAEALAREAFHNVAYFPGTFDQAHAAMRP